MEASTVKDLIVKALIGILFTLMGWAGKFAIETNTRLALMEWRMNYQVGQPPWAKGAP